MGSTELWTTTVRAEGRQRCALDLRWKWDPKHINIDIRWMEEILHQLVYGLPLVISLSTIFHSYLRVANCRRISSIHSMGMDQMDQNDLNNRRFQSIFLVLTLLGLTCINHPIVGVPNFDPYIRASSVTMIPWDRPNSWGSQFFHQLSQLSSAWIMLITFLGYPWKKCMTC